MQQDAVLAWPVSICSLIALDGHKSSALCSQETTSGIEVEMGKYDGGAHLLQAWSVLHQLCHLLLSAFHKGSGVIKDLLLPGKALGVAPQSFCLHTADMMNMALLVHITTVTSVCAKRQQHTPLLPVKQHMIAFSRHKELYFFQEKATCSILGS